MPARMRRSPSTAGVRRPFDHGRQLWRRSRCETRATPWLRRHAQARLDRVSSSRLVSGHLALLLLAEQPTLPAPPGRRRPRLDRGALSAAAAVVPGRPHPRQRPLRGGRPPDRWPPPRRPRHRSGRNGRGARGAGGHRGLAPARVALHPAHRRRRGAVLHLRPRRPLRRARPARAARVRRPPPCPRWKPPGARSSCATPCSTDRWLAVTALEARSGRWRLSPRLFGSADGQTVRAEMPASYRLWDSAPVLRRPLGGPRAPPGGRTSGPPSTPPRPK